MKELEGSLTSDGKYSSESENLMCQERIERPAAGVTRLEKRTGSWPLPGEWVIIQSEE